MTSSELSPAIDAILNKARLAVSDYEEMKHLYYTSPSDKSQIEEFLYDMDDRDLPEKPLKKGLLCLVVGEPDEALAALEQVSPDRVSSYLTGLCYLGQGRADLACEILEKHAPKDGDLVHFLTALIQAKQALGKYEESLKLLQSKPDLFASSPSGAYFRGLSQEMLGFRPEAIAAYEEAIKLDVRYAPAMFRLAYLADLYGDEETAHQYYEKISNGPTLYINALINRGLLHEDDEKYRDAITSYQAVLEAEPNHPRAKLYLKDSENSLSMFYDEEQERMQDRRMQTLKIPITDFELSVRSRNCLAKMKINSLGDLVQKTESELLSYKNFGETSLTEIREILHSKNLRLGMKPEETTPGKARNAYAGPSLATGNEALLSKPISYLELSVRSRKCMSKLNIATVGDLVDKTEPELLGCKNFGQTSLNEVKKKLTKYNLTLKP